MPKRLTVIVPICMAFAILWSPAGFSQIPHVVSTSPAQNALDVPISTSVSVTFDVDMDETTINDSTFVVNSRSTGLHLGSITYDCPTKTATFDPVEDFDEGEVVTVVLTTDMQSSGGIPLDSSYVCSFTVEANDGSGTFGPPSVYQAGAEPRSVYAADLDGDGDLELATADYELGIVTVWSNNGDGTFVVDGIYPLDIDLSTVFAADLDGDADIDLVTQGSSYKVSVLLNNGDGTFAPHSDYYLGHRALSLFAADLDGDGDIDLATGNYFAYSVSVLLNNGDGTFATYSEYEIGPEARFPASIFAADLDGDGDLDLTTGDWFTGSGYVSVVFNDGDGTFTPDSAYPVGTGVVSVFAVDVDGDGDLDIATANSRSDDVSVLLNNGYGTFALHSAYPVGNFPFSVFAADLDGDGDLDLTTANSFSNDVSVILNNGDGTFASDPAYAVGDCPRSVFAADLDGDGDLDLATAGDSSNVSVLLNQPPFIRGDANRDGIIDVGDIVYLVSYLYKNGPAPSPIDAGDANCDGIVDVGDIVYLVSYLYKNGPPPGC